MTITVLTNEDPDFYPTFGRFFGSRAVHSPLTHFTKLTRPADGS